MYNLGSKKNLLFFETYKTPENRNPVPSNSFKLDLILLCAVSVRASVSVALPPVFLLQMWQIAEM
jgi:hypothetical protein